MFNPQSIANFFEAFLHTKGYASLGDSDKIRKNPMGYLNKVLSVYEKISAENDKRSADFWEKYEDCQGKTIDDIGEERAKQMFTDFKGLFTSAEE